MKKDSFIEKRRKLADRLVAEGMLKTEKCIMAFLKVPREIFVWPGFEGDAYFDSPLPLGNTGQTISAPHMCAYLIEELDLRPGLIVLEVGGGSGYQAALVAECIAPSDMDKSRWGHIYTIEINRGLIDFAGKNLRESGYEDRVDVIWGDGSLGWPPLKKEEIYDRILLTAAAPEVPPPLIKQLKKNGVLIAPLGKGFFQDLVKIMKVKEEKIIRKHLIKVAFVPLRGKFGWKN